MDNGSEKERFKIIYVDDVNASLVTLKRRLSGYHEVYPAESAEMLFKALEKITPDIILLDINMPDRDGYDIIGSLKEDERYEQIPVIFITSHNDRESVVQGLTFGAVDFIVKPFETMSLIECIEKHVAESRVNKGKKQDNRQHILAVDDVVSELRIIKAALNAKYKVHTISKSESVLDFLKLRCPKLILLDYLMPALNGFELIPMIRSGRIQKHPDHYADIRRNAYPY
ncbi:MAG: response regulator [Treponema sp.]|nr:response regulator [Treponema sp.]